MPKTSQFFFLLCSVLAVPFLGSSNAHAFTIVNRLGQCLQTQFGGTTDQTPIVGEPCTGSFFQQWKWDEGAITGIGTGIIPNSSKCLTAFGSADGTPVTLVECQPVLHGLQKWIRGFPGQIVNVSLSKCLAVEDPTAGTQMTVRACDPNNPNQSWALRN
jgi:Ricin-type beta-trefoil lectin domain